MGRSYAEGNMESQHNSLQGNKFHTIPIVVWSKGSTCRRNQTQEFSNNDGGLTLPQRSRRQRLVRAKQDQGVSESAKILRRNEGMERPKSQTKSFRSRGPSSPMEPSYYELPQVGIKMGRVDMVGEKMRPGAYRLSDSLGKMLEYSWNADNLHHFYV
jgi:hypothetical protein